jgi:hypothetical protein
MSTRGCAVLEAVAAVSLKDAVGGVVSIPIPTGTNRWAAGSGKLPINYKYASALAAAPKPKIGRPPGKNARTVLK